MGVAVCASREGDLLSGSGNSHIATLVERHSRFTILVKVPSKDTATVVTALSRQVGKLPGLGQYETLGAAEFICNPKGIHRITDHLPKNWPDKNLQAVLRISIVNLKPTASEIVAFGIW